MLVLLPEISLALGFGQIKLYSYLNEPLDAEIELLGAEDVDISHVIASLAPAQDFQKIQLARPYFLTKLRFEVIQQGNRTAIQVSTQEAVKQPFLEFLVVLTWTEGRLVRGYTLLLDPAPLGTASQRDNLDAKEPVLIPKKDQQTLLRIQRKLSGNLDLIKPNSKVLAKTDNLVTQDAVMTKEKLLNPVIENLEALFDTESTKNPAPSSIERSPAIAVGSSAPTEEENEVIFSADLPNQAVLPSTGFFSKIVKSDFVVGFYENRLLLGSGLALLFSVALTVWFLKRARETLPMPAAVKIPPPLEKPVEIFDDEMNIKLELARQYITIQDLQSARDILEEVVARGNQREKDTAMLLLKKISSR